MTAITKDILNIAVVNFSSETGNKEKNLARMEAYADAAAKRGAELILFPEMALTGYGYFADETVPSEDKRKLAESSDGEAVRRMEAAAKRSGTYIVFGMPEKAGQNHEIMYNSAAVISPEGLIGMYRKIHPWANDNLWCAKGEEPLVFDSPWGKISVGICYDTYQFPEVTRYCIWKGARLHLNPTALAEEVNLSGSRAAWRESYEPHLKYLVLANSIYVASANLTGWDGKQYFGGSSAVFGPQVTPFAEPGCTLYAGEVDNVRPGIYIGTIDLSLASRPLCRENPYGGGTDYRPEIYKKLFDEIGDAE